MTKPVKISSKSFQEENDDQINIIAIGKTLWKNRKIILRILSFFVFLGVFIAIFSGTEYTASATITPQTNKQSGGGLSSLAAIAGVDLGGSDNSASISPRLYPQVINNVSFQKELLETPLTIKGQDKKVTYKEYYTTIYSPSLLSYVKKYTIGLPKLFIGLFKGKKIIHKDSGNDSSLITISGEEKILINRLKSQLSMELNPKDGYIILTGKMPEAIAVAELTQSALVLLEKYVIDFKIEKTLSQLDFIKKRYAEKEKEFKQIQKELASYTDRNQNVNSARAKTELMQLESEYNLIYSVYVELAKQLETQEIKVKEDTPIFTITEPVFVPIDKSKPKRILILTIWTFLGLLLSVGYVFGKITFLELKEKWLTYKN